MFDATEPDVQHIHFRPQTEERICATQDKLTPHIWFDPVTYFSFSRNSNGTTSTLNLYLIKLVLIMFSVAYQTDWYTCLYKSFPDTADCPPTDAVPPRSGWAYPSASWEFAQGVCCGAGCHNNSRHHVSVPWKVIWLGCHGNTHHDPWPSAAWAVSAGRGDFEPFKHEVRDQSRDRLKHSVPVVWSALGSCSIQLILLCLTLLLSCSNSMWISDDG